MQWTLELAPKHPGRDCITTQAQRVTITIHCVTMYWFRGPQRYPPLTRRVIAISPRNTAPVRPIILHAHMFKNAGTTLDWSLRRCFGEGFDDHRDNEPMRQPGDYLATYLSTHLRIKALSSHWLPVPLPILPGIAPKLVMLLRNPLERSRSVYNFERAQVGTNTPGNQKARKLPFEEYVKWRLEPGTGPVLKNFQTRFCSGDYFGQDMDPLFRQAKANLESLPLIGLVHRYAESMVLFEEGLRDVFPDIDLSWRVQNASQTEVSTQENRIEEIASELGDTYSSLIDANRYDTMLLQTIEEKFERKLSKIPDLEARLCSMHQRNELHQ